MTSEEDIIAMLDKLTKNEVSRIKINVEDNSEESASSDATTSPVNEYHHGRCDVGSPWAKGCAFDVLEDE